MDPVIITDEFAKGANLTPKILNSCSVDSRYARPDGNGHRITFVSSEADARNVPS